MEVFDNFGTSKSVTPGKTLSFTGSDIKDGVLKYILSFSKTAGAYDLSKVNRIRVKSNGNIQVDCTPTFYRSWMSRFCLNREVPASNATDITILGHMQDADIEPLDLPGANKDKVGGARGGMLAFDSGFELGGSAIELDVDATADASNATAVSWTRPEPTTYKVTHDFIAEAANIAVSAANGKYDITREGYLRGITLATTGIVTFRLYVGGQIMMNLPKAALIEAERTENSQTSPLTDPLTIRLAEPLLITKGTYIQLQTDGSWGGTTNEIGLYVMRDRRDVITASNKAGL
jgi:hypothetical protein